MDNVLDSQTGNLYSSILDNKFDAILEHYGQKNLVQNTMATQTSGGITYTAQSDDSVTCTGTYSANSYYVIANLHLKAGEYKLAGCPSGGGTSNYTLRLADTSDNLIARDDGNGTTFTLTSAQDCILRIYAYSNNISGKTFYPMLCDARIASDAYVPPAETRYWNYKTFSNTSAGVTSGSVRWITIGKVCFANFYDVVLTNVSHAHNAVLCTGLPPANTAILFLIQSWGTNYSGMRMRIDTDGTVYFHYAGTSTAQQHYGQVFYIIK